MAEFQVALFGAAKLFWREFAPAWIFPVLFLYGGLASERVGHPLAFFWLIAVPLLFWCFARAARPWLQGHLSYWHCVFWSMLVPFAIWAAAVYSRLVVIYLSASTDGL
jgi:hypothetical protein